MKKSLYYDIEGKPIPLLKWAELMEDVAYRLVGRTVVDEFTVSTVWIGIDHSMPWNDTTPLIFETMIFPDSDIWGRWGSYEQAVREHERAVAFVRTVKDVLPGIDIDQSSEQ